MLLLTLSVHEWDLCIVMNIEATICFSRIDFNKSDIEFDPQNSTLHGRTQFLKPLWLCDFNRWRKFLSIFYALSNCICKISVCSEGEFFNNVTSYCQLCSIGSWSPGGLVTECTSCAGNMITSTEGASNQEQCGMNSSYYCMSI